ncbi:MAG: AAA family ATPase [Spirochaetaceae bacterium]|jgi:flagellar biosynthesis protein FlhG|nr:AAA family ATPase [Spirochaetaceae bacterium]
MNKIIPFVSGKGGVGKNLLRANIGIELSRQGKTVILADLDFGAANLHTLLGMKNNREGLGSYLSIKNESLERFVCPTDYKRLYLIPGDELMSGMANHPYFMKKKLIKELKELTADYVLLDLGAGTNFNVVDYMLISNNPFIIITPDPPSILNAYGLIKNGLYRRLLRYLPSNSTNRESLLNALHGKIEGTEKSLDSILNLAIENQEETQNILSFKNEF